MEKNVQLFLILSLLVFLGTMTYMQKKYPPRPAASAVASAVAAPGGTAPPAGTPDAAQAATTTSPTSGTLSAAAAPKEIPEGPRVSVKTETYDVVFSTNGAAPIQWDIVNRTEEKATTVTREHMIDPKLEQHRELARPFQTVLQELGSRYYNEFNTEIFQHKQLDEAGLVHEFTSPPVRSGLRMVKTYSFSSDPKEQYQAKLEIKLINEGKANLTFGGERGLGLILGPGLGGDSNGLDPVARYATVDAAVDSGGDFLYDHIPAAVGLANGTTPGTAITYDHTHILSPMNWGAIIDKYFIAAIAPDAGTSFVSANSLLDNRTVGTLTLEPKNAGNYPQLELYGAPFTLAAGSQAGFSYTIYIGPMQYQAIAGAGHNLTRAMFHSSYNWMRTLCFVLLNLLFWLHKLLGNWGVAIMALTFTVRLATLPFVHKGLKSQAKMTQEMAKIKPLMDKLNEKYKDDPSRKQQEVFKLYREHNINPLGMLKGCGWMMIQMPIFFGLYALLYQVIDLRGAHFLWIKDLSQADHLFAFGFTMPLLGAYFNILPFIVALTQMMTSKFMQTPSTDPQQAQMQQMMTFMMPLMVLYFTYPFPSGLMLYWFVSNAWQVLQQIYVNKVIKKPEQKPGPPSGAAVQVV